jgi:hypothetical protein
MVSATYLYDVKDRTIDSSGFGEDWRDQGCFEDTADSLDVSTFAGAKI